VPPPEPRGRILAVVANDLPPAASPGRPIALTAPGTLREPLPGMRCPALNIFGTFFPSWMLCAVIGIAGAIAAFKVLSALRIDPSVGPRLLVYPCLGLAITSLIWLVFYGH